MDDDDPHRWREEEQIEREAAGDLLAHIRARREADEAGRDTCSTSSPAASSRSPKTTPRTTLRKPLRHERC